MVRFTAVIGIIIALGWVISAAAGEGYAGMLRYPDVSATQVVFVYDNDVWVAPKHGGVATPLSSPAGQEANPKFSPDGKTVAFSGNYDGNLDVYSMPVAGGNPKRLTYHPYRDTVIDYAPDGLVIFNSWREPLFPSSRLFFTDPDGGLATALPVAYGYSASLSSDSAWLAFTPWTREFDTWNRYEGGTATDIWLFNMATYDAERVTTHPGTDDMPMFAGGKLYYLSDAGPEHRRNIWAYDVKSKQRTQVTCFTEYEVKWPSIGPEELVFEYGGELYLLNLASGESKQINITVPGDHPSVRSELVDAAGFGGLESVSPSAKRVCGSFRGDIWTVPAEKGYKVNLTQTPGAAERTPVWSPDGKWIAYFSDSTGEYELYIHSTGKDGEVKQLTHDTKTFYFSIVWSPDSKKIAFSDKAGQYSIHLIDSAETIQFDKDAWANENGQFSWAKDSNWLAYRTASPDNGNGQIKLYDLTNRASHTVTSSMFNSFEPAFDLGGDYLYFATDRSFNPTFSPIDDWGAHFFVDSAVLAYVPLRADVKSPFALENDTEEVKEDEAADKDEAGAADAADADKDETGDEPAAETSETPAGEVSEAPEAEEKDDAAKEGEEEKKEEPLKIDIEGFEARARLLPVPPAGYWNLLAGDKKLFYLRGGQFGMEAPSAIYMFDLATQEEQKVLDGAGGFQLTPDVSKMLVFAEGGAFITGAGPGAALNKRVDASNMLVEVDPRAEWPQLVHDAWRIYRDFFYDPGMHGVDWELQLKRAQQMVRHAANREDIDYIIGQMIAELNVGHAYVYGGPAEAGKQLSVGVLGCDFELAADADGHTAYRIKKIYRAGEWDLDMAGPLSEPGLDVKEGDFVLAVNGRPISTELEPWAAFAGTAEVTTALTVSDKAVIDDTAREVLVEPAGNDFELRFRAWMEQNRAYVSEKSGGRIGYIYVRDTSEGGFSDMMRQFMGQYQLDGLIIDERWNGGGLSPHRMVELLNRPIHQYWALRDSESWRTPQFAHVGPKAMLTNHAAGSGGDSFPYIFKQMKVGPLIGTRTWGGLVGLSGNPGLIDGGYYSVPTFGVYDAAGTWAVEGHGVDPNIEVVDDPGLLAKGQDPQLDAAIAWVLAEIEKHPPVPVVPKPQYPNRSGMGIPERDK